MTNLSIINDFVDIAQKQRRRFIGYPLADRSFANVIFDDAGADCYIVKNEHIREHSSFSSSSTSHWTENMKKALRMRAAYGIDSLINIVNTLKSKNVK